MGSPRHELEQACARVRRQIEIEESTRSFGSSVNNQERIAALVDGLRATLAELEGALADLEKPDA
jgi:hypothetical protein